LYKEKSTRGFGPALTLGETKMNSVRINTMNDLISEVCHAVETNDMEALDSAERCYEQWIADKETMLAARRLFVLAWNSIKD